MATKAKGRLKLTDTVLVTSIDLTADVGSSILPVANGGTNKGSWTNGQIPIGNTTGNTLVGATITQSSANQVVVTNGAGSITLSLPQDIATSSNVQFGGIGIGTAVGTGQAVNVSYAAPAASGGQGLLFITTFAPSGSSANSVYGFFGSARNSANQNLTAAGGGVVGGLGIGLNLSGTSNIMSLIVGLKGIAQNLNTGVVTRGTALMAGSPAASAANVMTTACGLLIQVQNGLGRTNAWGIYQEDAGDSNFFSGNILKGQGQGWGVTSTATAAGTTTLTSSSKVVQIFTGSTTQTVTLPAANLFGAGIAVIYVIKNRSSGTVTINRAGSDTIDGGTSTTLTGGANASVTLASDGVSAWVII